MRQDYAFVAQKNEALQLEMEMLRAQNFNLNMQTETYQTKFRNAETELMELRQKVLNYEKIQQDLGEAERMILE